jgi:hypothetical protein
MIKCSECEYWQKEDVRSGKCRLHPPVVVGVQAMQTGIQGMGGRFQIIGSQAPSEADDGCAEGIKKEAVQ